jgi:hypothetical protein
MDPGFSEEEQMDREQGKEETMPTKGEDAGYVGASSSTGACRPITLQQACEIKARDLRAQADALDAVAKVLPAGLDEISPVANLELTRMVFARTGW